MPAGNDGDSVKPGGLAMETLGGRDAGHDSVMFQDMM